MRRANADAGCAALFTYGIASRHHLPQPKSAVTDFGHFVKWPNPRYSEVRLGGGRPAQAGRVGVTAVPQNPPGLSRGTAATPPRTAFGSPTLPLQGRVLGTSSAAGRPPPAPVCTKVLSRSEKA